MNDKMLDYLLATDSMDEFLGDKSRCYHCGSKLLEGEMPEYHCNNCRRSYTKDLKRYIEEENNIEDYDEDYYNEVDN